MTRKTVIAMMMAAVWTGAGCGRAFREGLGEVRGASGLVMAINPASGEANPSELAQYRHFVLGEIRDDIGGLLPERFPSLLREEFDKQLADKHLPNDASGQTLLVRGTVIHYEDTGTIGTVVSPLEEVICRTEFVDQSSGKVLAVVNCIGRTDTSLNRGVRRSRPWSTNTQVSWSPIARWISAAATDESTPPDRPRITSSPPTCARIAATASAT